MGFADAIRAGFANYVTFSGRAQRSAFWYWTLFVLLGSIVAEVLDGIIFSGIGGEGNGPLNGLWGLAALLPSIAIAVRRLHDLDRSGWWYLLVALPLIGWIVLVIFFVQRGGEGPNRFGEDPFGTGTSPFKTARENDAAFYTRSNIPRVDRTD